MPSMRIASPERRWRATAAPLIAGWIGWLTSGSLRLGVHRGVPPEVPLTPQILVTCLAVTVGIGLAVLILRTRAYSRVPSAHHLDELTRIRWSLEDAAARHAR